MIAEFLATVFAYVVMPGAVFLTGAHRIHNPAHTACTLWNGSN